MGGGGRGSAYRDVWEAEFRGEVEGGLVVLGEVGVADEFGDLWVGEDDALDEGKRAEVKGSPEAGAGCDPDYVSFRAFGDV